MKAIVYTEYGPPEVFQLKEVDKPVVKENGVLVRVNAAAINAGDYFMMSGSPWLIRLMIGFPNPKNHILGWDVAGCVEKVGKEVKQFHPGDEVFGSCNHGFAEYVSADDDKFALKPTNLTFQQAAAVPTAGLTALQGLRDKGKVQPGQKVLINGASGGVGTFAVQIAKSFGAEVTGVCSTKNVEMVLSIGADHVIDYTKEDFTKSGQRYDLILDNVGNHSPSALKRALTPQGTSVPNSGHGGMGYLIKAFILSAFMDWQESPWVTKPNNKDLVILKELIEAGKINPVIDRTYPLRKTPEAIGYVGRGHAKGKVVVTVEHDTK
ncbi:MAG: NAD(P)-dependent alcohol dehydrogenase [Candidatus Methanofastidiosia archaeon]